MSLLNYNIYTLGAAALECDKGGRADFLSESAGVRISMNSREKRVYAEKKYQKTIIFRKITQEA